ncbi:hypothetical protein [Thermomicrobium sp. CFH 73360]|uniref:hypothetical protein n=1 Tax=Thermomicrobium sp. CFH 73360 TaxID=2951987 RepID=UPI00336BF18A
MIHWGRTQLRPPRLSTDLLVIERRWGELDRSQVHGRKGAVMMAISAIDCALWDLLRYWDDASVHPLFGAPVRTKLPVCASPLGFSRELERATARARQRNAEKFSRAEVVPALGTSQRQRGAAPHCGTLQRVAGRRRRRSDAGTSWSSVEKRATVRQRIPYASVGSGRRSCLIGWTRRSAFAQQLQLLIMNTRETRGMKAVVPPTRCRCLHPLPGI